MCIPLFCDRTAYDSSFVLFHAGLSTPRVCRFDRPSDKPGSRSSGLYQFTVLVGRAYLDSLAEPPEGPRGIWAERG
jgi:hypothetical protein